MQATLPMLPPFYTLSHSNDSRGWNSTVCPYISLPIRNLEGVDDADVAHFIDGYLIDRARKIIMGIIDFSGQCNRERSC